MKISIVIPTYECYGRGVEFVERGVKSALRQTHKDYEIIISDQSNDDKIEKYCLSLNNIVRYYRNPNDRGSSSANLNNAISYATGEIIKPLFMDDYFGKDTALSVINEKFVEGSKWLACGCTTQDDRGIRRWDNFVPKWNDQIIFGHNTISGPSVIAYLKCDIKWDERLVWLMDCKFYQDMFERFGLPDIIDTSLIINFLHDKQYTKTMSEARQKSEEFLMRSEYKHLLREVAPPPKVQPKPQVIVERHSGQEVTISALNAAKSRLHKAQLESFLTHRKK